MSWKTRLAGLITEFGEGIVERAIGVLGDDASEAEVKAAASNLKGTRRANVPLPPKPRVAAPVTPARRAAATAPKRKPAPPSLAVVPPAAPAIISARSGQPLAVAQDVLHEAANPSKGRAGYSEWRAANPDNGTLFDLSKLDRVPNVPQYQIPRYDPPRGPSARITEALSDPEVAQGINDTVQRGIEGGGKEWYNTEPVLDRMGNIMPSIDAPQHYAALMDLMAATSPRSKVTDNVRTGSYYNYLRSRGLPIPDKPEGGYGSIAQNLHRDNARGLAARGGWDIFKNPKPASFSSNLQGNQEVATIDTHNFRLPGILSEDPRFLETSIKELADNPDAARELLKRQYPGLPDEAIDEAVRVKPSKGFDKKGNPKPDETSIVYKPQAWVNAGHIPMETALKDPALWTSKPNDNEYGYYEKWQQEQAKNHFGISPAQYQASMWLGGGEDTGLGSAPEPFTATLEARMRYTADQLGLPPEKVRDMMLKGEIPLLAKGGRVEEPSLAVTRR